MTVSRNPANVTLVFLEYNIQLSEPIAHRGFMINITEMWWKKQDLWLLQIFLFLCWGIRFVVSEIELNKKRMCSSSVYEKIFIFFSQESAALQCKK